MRRAISVIVLMVSALHARAGATQDSVTLSQELRSGSIRVRADSSVSRAAMSEVLRAAETSRRRIEVVIGAAERTREIEIQLLGSGARATGPRAYPFVDRFGVVHLFEYDESGYTGQLAHELVHAVRRLQGARASGFVEEGFASLIASRVEDHQAGFVLYGFPQSVVAGGWLLRENQFIPLAILREKHADLNLRCRFQTYSLRPSFFEFLWKRFGEDAVMALAYEGRDDEDQWRRLFGRSIDALDGEWRDWLRKQFRGGRRSESLFEKYLATTPAGKYPICHAGRDF